MGGSRRVFEGLEVWEVRKVLGVLKGFGVCVRVWVGVGGSGRVQEGPGGSEGLKWSGRVQLGQMRVLDCLERFRMVQ